MRRSSRICAAFAIFLASAFAAGAAEQKPADPGALPAFCNPQQKDPQIIYECSQLADAKAMSDSIGAASGALTNALGDLQKQFKELEKRDLELRMKIAPGKNI